MFRTETCEGSDPWLGSGPGTGMVQGQGRVACHSLTYRGVPCYMLYTETCAPREAEAVMGAPWGTCGPLCTETCHTTCSHRGMCNEGGRSRDGCPLGDMWAALHRGVPCYMLIPRHVHRGGAEAVMGAL